MALRRAARSVLTHYDAALTARPITTKTASAGVLAFGGDVVAQHVMATKKSTSFELDTQRLAAFTTFGIGWTGLFNHYWFGWLSRVIPGAGLSAVVGKTIVQHGFCNPMIYLPTFYIYNGIATGTRTPPSHSSNSPCYSTDVDRGTAGRTSAEIVSKAKEEYMPTLYKLWSIWVPSTAVQFALVPTQYQVTFVEACSIGVLLTRFSIRCYTWPA